MTLQVVCPLLLQALEQELHSGEVDSVVAADVDVSNLSRSMLARSSAFVSCLGEMTSVCLSKHSEVTLALETMSSRLQSVMARQEESLSTISSLLMVRRLHVLLSVLSWYSSFHFALENGHCHRVATDWWKDVFFDRF
jgi:hypothetical protein